MKKRLLAITLGLFIISSFGANASSREQVKQEKFTGWNYDSELKQDTYYKDGNMVTNTWINPSEKWYFMKVDGTKATGWIQINNNWYYFDSQGVMQTGWVRDVITQKYYYLNSDGTMMHDATTPDGYKIGSDGVWIK